MDTDRNPLHPLSSPQHAVWLDQSLLPDVPCYNIGAAFELRGPLAISHFEAAIADVVRTCDALRIVLEKRDGECMQRFCDGPDSPLEYFDYTKAVDGESLAWTHIERAIRIPFDLRSDALWRMQWLQVEPERGYWLLCFHHLVADGLSVSIVAQSVIAAYNRRVQSETQAVADDAIVAAPAYRDFVAQDADYLSSARFVKDREFWLQRFPSMPGTLFDAPKSEAVDSCRGCEQVVWRMDRDSYTKLEQVAAVEGASSTHFLLTSIAVHFARQCGWRDEVVIGMPVHNRTNAAYRRTVGMFSTMIPIGIPVDPTRSFMETLRAVAAELRRCFRHQRFPLVELQRELLAGSRHRSGMFDVALSMGDFPFDLQIEGGVTASIRPLHNGHERHPLGIYVRNYECAMPVDIEFNFDPNVIDKSAAETLVRRIERLTRAAIAAPDTVLSSLPWLDEAEYVQVVSEFNATARDCPRDLTVHALFEAQAAKTPEAAALVFGEARLSYGELNARANRLAHHLIALGVRPDDRVAICVERSVEMVVGLLGILKAGGAYVPIEPATPPGRIAYMLADCAPSVILVHGLGREAVRPHVTSRVRKLDLLCDAYQWQSQPDGDPLPAMLGLTSRHLAYVIYTSGTTGAPKGVMIEHASVTACAIYGVAEYALTSQDRCLQFASFAFDASVLQIFSTLASGAALIAREQALWSSEEVAAQIARYRITIACVPPSYLQGLLTPAAQRGMTDLRILIIGGEATSSATLRGKSFDHMILNEYGPTEATVLATNFAVHPHVPIAFDTMHLPIGRPIANTQVYLLDAQRLPVPIGAVGEIYIGGAGVARGYLNRPELTADRFLDDPFSAEADARMYKTGDLGRWMIDGAIEFLGRNDFQVKIRGFRIEPGEIKAALTSCDGVREAAVIACESPTGEQRLVAYCLADIHLSAGDLRQRLSQHLPEYMVPAAFVRLEAWPLTANGKLDRKALPAPDDAAYARAVYESPEGEIEETLAATWGELLKLDRVGRGDNFFELGGHSLLAVQLISRLHSVFHVEVPLRAVFDSPTLSQLAALIAQADASQLSAITVVERGTYMPLSLAQQRLWVLTHIDGASAAYHMGGALKLEGVLDCLALQRALQRIVDRHEALRTRFVLVDGQPMQAIMAEARIVPSSHDLRDRLDRDTVCRSLNDAFMAKHFDLRHDLLLRVQLVQLEDRVHELQVVMHHIVSDGWSIGIMLDELSRLYAVEVQGQAEPLPVLPIQYVDYSQWQRAWLADGHCERQIAFWRKTLVGAPTLLELPADYSRPLQQDFAGAALDVQLDASLTSQLKTLSLRHGVTLYMTLLASWAAVLGRLSNQDEVVIGSPVAGRNRAEVESLIGFFVNTLALRIDLGDDPTIGALLARTKRQVLDAHAHQDLPFDQVVEAVKPPRSTAHSPIFQTMLTLNNQKAATLEMPGLNVLPVALEICTAQFDLSLDLFEADGALSGCLGYARSLFDRGTVERYLGYWITWLRGMVTEPNQKASDLSMLDDAERKRLLVEWNDTAQHDPQDRCVHALFEARVLLAPEATALVFGEEQLSYAELNRRANRLAHHLRMLGVVPDDRVAICVERSIEMVVGLLGILKAGAAYVPLEPATPAERIAHVLTDSTPVAVLVCGPGREAVLGHLPDDVPVLDLQLDEHLWRLQPDGDAGPTACGLTTRHLAYVIYTSGTTGTPKGVMIEHASVTARAIHGINQYAITPQDRCLQFASFGFDASVMQIFPALAGGAALILRDRSLWSPDDVVEQIGRHRVTIADVPTSYLEALLAPGSQRAMRDLRMLIIGGEATLSAALRGKRFNQTILNEYGPTEATVTATSFAVHPHAEIAQNTMYLPIGRPIASTAVYLLDGRRVPVPIGVVGELYISGCGVARGYLNRPELTMAHFLDDPYSPDPAARMYKTGDLGRWMADGNIEYVGRNDFQVKIRGFRVELGEIEAALTSCDGVREAAVIVYEDTSCEKRLVAYYLADAPLDTGDLRRQLSHSLPEYMVPAAFVRLEAWPLTASGKLDRRALPAPDDDAYASRGYEAPEGEFETALARIWSELLFIDRVGRNDNFFELGGHSLLAVRLISRLHRVFSVEMPLRAVFESPILSQLADRITRADASQLSAITVVERGKFMPLSLAQQRLWVLTQIDGASAAYHMCGALKLEGALDGSALQRALQRIVDRHEALRTRFVRVDDEPMQAIMAEARIVPSIHDLRDRIDRDTICRGLSAAFMAKPFDLRHDLLLRVQLIRLEEHVHELQVVMHHIVSDGWSIGIMMNELSRLYAADVQGRTDPLPALPIQYVDYSQWQRQWLAEGRLARQSTFWQRNLAGAPTLLELPTDRRRPSQQDFLGDTVDVRLDTALTASLKALSQRHGVTLYMTLLATWAAVLGRLSNQDDVVIGSPVAGRNRAEVESLIGFFINTVALRIDLSGDPTTGTLLSRTRQCVLDAHAHQDLPFDQVVEAIKPSRSMAHAPIFQTMLAWQNQAEGRLQMPGVEVSPVGIPATRAQLDLTLSLGEIGGEIVGDLNYATTLFDRGTVVRFSRYWTRLLQGMLADPASPMARLPMLDERERECILDTWNDTALDYPAHVCVHQLFEAQVARAPEATALVFGERRIRYGELNARANQLAHVLRARGTGRGTLVAVAVERGVEMIVALLAILKAGGAYVPMAPDAPPARLAFMLSDAKPLLLLTDAATRIDDAVIDVPVVLLDALGPQLEQCPQTNVGSDGCTSSQPAYVIYTSGTTGMPKGVLVSQRNLINFCYWCTDVGLFKAGDRMTQFAPYTFDASAGEIFGGLLAGAELHLLDDATIQDPAALQRYLTLHAIQFSSFPPAYLQQIDPSAVPPGFKLLTAGSAPTPALVKRWAGRGRYLNGYGPTETTILSTSTWLSAEANTITIGRPIANTQIYLLDAHRQPVPIGATGEIHIGGDGVALGYLNRPELTAALFLDDPFSAQAGARMYKTGDLGRWMADGTIEFLGRSDFQVKIRGFRIELGEIEAKLCALADIREAVVIAREEGQGEQSLVAYYLGDRDSAVVSLREQLLQHLPDYMVPSAFVRLETWPLTSNGKLDRHALPLPGDAAYARQAYASPEGETEQTLAQIWSELLGIERVGRHDNFFDLGGHSLLAIKLVHRLRMDLVREITVADVFDAGTPARMAERIEYGRPAARTVDMSSEAVLAEDIWPLHQGARASSPPKRILLTGATGFIGRFLLRQLLDATDATIYCLVRSDGRQKAFARIREVMIKANLWKAADALRIVACPGDLAHPKLGLSSTDYIRICDEVDSIYHNGTSMNHLESYASAKRANVDGVQELLRIATQGKDKTFNYVSTLDVFANHIPRDGQTTIDETSSIDEVLHQQRDGYAASKWVGELLVQIAKTRGMPCNVFRLGLVVGDLRCGRYDEKQRLHRIMTSALRMKTAFTDARLSQYLLPVDYVAEAMVVLSMKHPHGGGVFHLASNSPVSMDEIFSASSAAFGESFETVPATEWLRRIGALHEAGTTLPVMPLLSDQIRLAQEHAPAFNDGADSAHLFDCSRTLNELAALGMQPPNMGMQVFARYWRAIRDDAEGLSAATPDRKEMAES